MTLTRRQVFSTLGIGVLAFGARPSARHALEQATAPTPPFSLAPLPYPFEALEPHIDAQTMRTHHEMHHRAHVSNLNAAVARAGAAGRLPLEQMLRHLSQLPEPTRSAVRSDGGGHWNHTQFWTVMAPNGGGAPTGPIADAIHATFGGFETFKQIFTAAALGRAGSGWAWLSEDNGRLVIHSTADQDTPLMENKRPIVGLDLWDHAYHLTYRDRPADYVAAFWYVINWAEVNKRLKG